MLTKSTVSILSFKSGSAVKTILSPFLNAVPSIVAPDAPCIVAKASVMAVSTTSTIVPIVP